MNRTTVPDEFRSTKGGDATDKQLDLIRSLASEREMSEEHRSDLLRRVKEHDISKKRASDFITRLLDLPKRQQRSLHDMVSDETPDVPAGRYAVENEDGELRFYRVDRPTRGRWEGYTFVKVEHGPDESNVKGFKARVSILNKIKEAGLREAAIRYGHEIGACSNCGRRLTNRVSRELGIGPVCGGRMFEDFGSEVTSAREAIVARGEDPDEEVE